MPPKDENGVVELETVAAEAQNPLVPPLKFKSVSPMYNGDQKDSELDTSRTVTFTGTIDQVLGKIAAYERRADLFLPRKDFDSIQRVFRQCEKILIRWKETQSNENENSVLADGSGSRSQRLDRGANSLDGMRINLRIAHCKRILGLVNLETKRLGDAKLELYKAMSYFNGVLGGFGLCAKENAEHLIELEKKLVKAAAAPTLALEQSRFRWKEKEEEEERSAIDPILGHRKKAQSEGLTLGSCPIPARELIDSMYDYWRTMDTLAHCYYTEARELPDGTISRRKLILSCVRMLMKAVYVANEILIDSYTVQGAAKLTPMEKIPVATDIIGLLMSLGKAYLSGEFFEEALICTTAAKGIVEEHKLLVLMRDVTRLRRIIFKRRRGITVFKAAVKIKATWQRYRARIQYRELRTKHRAASAATVIAVACMMMVAPHLRAPTDLQVFLARSGFSEVSPRLLRHKIQSMEQVAELTPQKFPLLGFSLEKGTKIVKLAQRSIRDREALAFLKERTGTFAPKGAEEGASTLAPKPPPEAQKPPKQFHSFPQKTAEEPTPAAKAKVVSSPVEEVKPKETLAKKHSMKMPPDSASGSVRVPMPPGTKREQPKPPETGIAGNRKSTPVAEKRPSSSAKKN